MLAGPIIVLLAAGYWYLSSGRYESTDDAYIQAARTQVSTDVSGRVVEIDVKDNQKVNAGQVLFRLDPRPFRIAVEEAKAQLAAVRYQIHAMKATYHQKRADAKAAEATADYQDREFERQKRLLVSGTASQQQFEQAKQASENARQQLASKQQDVAVALANIGGDPDLPLEQHPMVQHAQAALDRAELNLTYAEIRAPENGIVTKVDQLQVGDYVTAGTQLFSLMSSDRVWVEANFKETELTHMRPGQRATVELDTYPDVVFSARVESLSPGTGLTFSLLPAENATGNWVKVVQRLPVRLSLTRLDSNAPLQAGLSATVEVDTGYRRPWLDRVQRVLAWVAGPTTRAAER
ncbi:MAG: HlyD family secretion protein [Alphaproteobacteria bacterium]|nr:HlyD family secretion protein [Alphaproteobacteria bacterium]